MVASEREREEWGHGHAPPAQRPELSEVTRGLAQSRAKALAIELEAPEYVRSTLGDRPLAPAARERWSHAVWAVEEYRDRYGVEDPLRALGSRPAAGLQRADYDVTAKSVERAIGGGLALERGVALRPAQGLGLSL